MQTIGGAGFSLQRRLQPPSGPGLKPRLQAKARSTGRSLLLPLAFLTSCGYVGSPLPPALDIPSAVMDLRAVEYGGNLVVEFTIPPLTTEGLPLKSLRSVELYAGPPNAPFNADAWAATAKRYEVPADAPGPVAFDKIAAGDFAGGTIALLVRATGPKGKVSSWSNAALLAVGPPLATPAGLRAENVIDGVKLTWRGAGPKYRVFRWTGSAQPAPAAETDQPEYLDASAQYGAEYRYMVQAIEGESRQSIVSETVMITPKDIFPPAVPSDVTAAAGANTIELTWTRNTEADFKGYNVYRSEGAGPAEKIASLIEAPVYSDTKVEPGKTYRYEISAVDLLGNESARSGAVTAALP